jgi:5-epi-alpha-selinene synthase
MNKLFRPDLYCPFPYQTNNHFDALEEHGIDWVLRLNLLANESAYQRFTNSKFALLISGCYPECQLEELEIAHDWLTWILIWDDQCDMSDIGKNPQIVKSFHKRFMEILKGAKINSQDIPVARALSDLRQRMLPRADAKWFYHFICTVENYLDGLVEEAANRGENIVPDIETYIKLRRLTGAMEPLIELIEFCNHLVISDFTRKHNIFTKLKVITNDIVCWCNDIFSAPREMESGDFHNLALLIHSQEKIPVEQAIQRAVEMHNQKVQVMVSLALSMPSFGQAEDTEVAKYISGMQSWISSSLNWYSYSGRYDSQDKLDVVLSTV